MGDADLTVASGAPGHAEGGEPYAHGPCDMAKGPVLLRQLVSDHLDFIWRSLRRFGVSESDADDATQQVFVIADKKLAHIAAGKERSFLIGIAMRVAAHTRRAHQRRDVAEQGLSSSPRASNPDPEELAQRIEARELLDRVLDEMPDELRAIFVLFELEELSIDEIAALLSLPRGTASSRLRRAREVFHQRAARLDMKGKYGGGSP
jgi:RNA polymerase sigma-70 factor (ECF subfamily)